MKVTGDGKQLTNLVVMQHQVGGLTVLFPADDFVVLLANFVALLHQCAE